MGNANAASTLLAGVFDDASLFPPAELPMADAITGHVRHRRAWYSWMSGPFACTDTRLGQLSTALTAANLAEIDLALIVTGGAGGVGPAVDEVAADPRLRLRSVEVPARPAAADQDSVRAAVTAVLAALDGVPLAGARGYAEVPLAACDDGVLHLIDEHRYRLKLRTGGLAAAAFPDEAALAACLAALAEHRLAFKCTAGLHHAVRHTAADTGFEHHGFLNLLLATVAAADGAPAEATAVLLASRDGADLAARAAALAAADAARARDLLTSIGTCSTDEPVADLVALGIVSQP